MKKSIPFPSALPFSISRGDRDLVIPGTRFSVPRMLHGPNVLTVRNGVQQTHAAGTITAPSLASSANWNETEMRTERSPLESSSNHSSHQHRSRFQEIAEGAKGKGKGKTQKTKWTKNNKNLEAICKSATNHELTKICKIARIHQYEQKSDGRKKGAKILCTKFEKKLRRINVRQTQTGKLRNTAKMSAGQLL